MYSVGRDSSMIAESPGEKRKRGCCETILDVETTHFTCEHVETINISHALDVT